VKKWRPSFKCIYIIPEIHGNIESLTHILDRVLPLRSHTGQEDVIVFLGDYVDGDESGADVIETLITVKKEYGERVILLRGNHDDLFAKAISGTNDNYNDWITANGHSTINSYIQKYNSYQTIDNISATELKELIPKEHKDFLTSLETYHILDEYFFMHGSFDPNKTVKENRLENFIYDVSASRYVKDCLKKKSKPDLKDNYVFVSAHNFNTKIPFIYQKYLMLGGGAPNELYVWDLNSMECCRIRKGKERIYPYKFSAFE